MSSNLRCLLKVQCQSEEEVIEEASWAGLIRGVEHVSCIPGPAALTWYVTAWGKR